MLLNKSYFDNLSIISVAYFLFFLIPIAYSTNFLYSSRVILIDKKLFYMENGLSATFLIILAILHLIKRDSQLIKCILCLIISIISSIIEITAGTFIANDPLLYITSLERSWHLSNISTIKKIQEKFECCDFQPTIIDARNECHHGFAVSFIEVLNTRYARQIKNIGVLFIIQGFIHLTFFFLTFTFFMKDTKYIKPLKNNENNDCIPLNQINWIIKNTKHNYIEWFDYAFCFK